MSENTNIYLVGFMGTGKTSVGKDLANRLGMDFVDMDDVIVQRAGKTIPEIFTEDGEPHFRTIERGVAHDLAAGTGLVVATGGGVVMDNRNMDDFYRSGSVVCLSASPETILKRVAEDTNRPLLAGDLEEKLAKILPLLEKRRRHYEAIPSRVDTSDLTIEEVVERILDLCSEA